MGQTECLLLLDPASCDAQVVGELLLGYPGLGLFRVLVVHCCRSEQTLAAISRAVAVTMLLLASFSRMAIVPAL